MGNKWGNSATVADFILGGYKITAGGNCSHEIKRRLLLGRKVMTNLDSIFKSRNITLPTKVCLVKALVFPVVMCGCEEEAEAGVCWELEASGGKIGDGLQGQLIRFGRGRTHMGDRWGNSGNSVRRYFWGLQNHCRW